MIALGGLWKNKSKAGRNYLSGKLSPTVKIMIFANGFKETENQPDYQMYLAPVEKAHTTGTTADETTPADDFLSE